MGFIEVVKNARSIADIQKDAGGAAAAAFSKTTLQRWLRQHNPSEEQFSRAVHNFTYSCAGYTVASYILGLGDRHNDNIMVTKSGNLFRKCFVLFFFYGGNCESILFLFLFSFSLRDQISILLIFLGI